MRGRGASIIEGEVIDGMVIYNLREIMDAEQGHIYNPREIIDEGYIYNDPNIMDWKGTSAIHNPRGIIDKGSIYNIPGFMDCLLRLMRDL